MDIRNYFLVILLAFAVARGHLLAEVPPLSKDELENQAALIVTGTVTDVKVGQAKPRADGKEYNYELTVLVETVKKGKSEKGATLKVRGSYIKLKPRLVGGSGHRSDNTGDRMNAIEPDWKLALYLTEPKDGVHSIVYPNGFAVAAKPAKEPNHSLWIWIALIAVLIIVFWLSRRPGKRAEHAFFRDTPNVQE
jgi:hypothetical protein